MVTEAHPVGAYLRNRSVRPRKSIRVSLLAAIAPPAALWKARERRYFSFSLVSFYDAFIIKQANSFVKYFFAKNHFHTFADISFFILLDFDFSL